jgi:hypothetical protein
MGFHRRAGLFDSWQRNGLAAFRFQWVKNSLLIGHV